MSVTDFSAAYLRSGEDQAMDLAGFTPAERQALRVARDTPDAGCTPDQTALLLRYENARNELLYGEEVR